MKQTEVRGYAGETNISLNLSLCIQNNVLNYDQ